MKISKRQQNKNSKVLEYLAENDFLMAYKELVISSKSKWRIFRLYKHEIWLKVNYHGVFGIQARYQKDIPKILPKPKKTNYIIRFDYMDVTPTIVKLTKECSKETIREDISFSTLVLLKILSNNKVNYMKVEYYL